MFWLSIYPAGWLAYFALDRLRRVPANVRARTARGAAAWACAWPLWAAAAALRGLSRLTRSGYKSPHEIRTR